MAVSCLSIIVAKLNGQAYYAGSEMPDPDTDLGLYYDEYLELNAVTRCQHSRTAVWDEGDTRVLYHDHSVVIEAVLTNDQLYGDLTEPGGDAQLYTFNQKLEIISNFLSNQGLGINFGHYPGPIRRLVPGNENNDNTVEYVGTKGWLIDNFNGPKVDDVDLLPMPGGEAVRLVWKVRYRTFFTDTAMTTDNMTPKISSELRMDIDRDGDIVIRVDGTIYASSLKDLYYARNWLEIQYQPTKVENIIQSVHVGGNQNIAEDKFAMVNGFHKTVQFNVEKNGRSARFGITYSQVKSNNALPLGLRDITFDQSIESSLLSGGWASGKGFTTWKQSFKGKIKVPARLHADYAWYIFHLLMQQQLRNTTVSVSTKMEEVDLEESETSEKIYLAERYAKALPIRIKITHSHYSRNISFEVDYVILCPLKYILAVSCILNRVNNDYQRRLTETNREYKPLKVSEQWWYWNRSTDPGVGFNPESPSLVNPYASGRPHRDTGGTEIVDTGHNYDAYKQLDGQNRQKNVLVTTVIDPNENDPTYQTNDESQPSKYSDPAIPGYDKNTPTLDKALKQTTGLNAAWKGLKPYNPMQLLTGTRGGTEYFDPERTWIRYEQDYEIVEVNNTVPVEGLSDITTSDYYSLKREKVEEYYGKDTDGNIKETYTKVAANTGAKFFGREDPAQYETDYEQWVGMPESEQEEAANPVFRKTYAASPSRYYLVVRGVAMRVANKIHMPQVIRIAGKEAVRVGEARFRHKNIAPDADLPVYLAMWEQVYTVDSSVLSSDILSQIEDTGASMLYV